MLLELKNIKKHYRVRKGSRVFSGNLVKAVDDVSLTVSSGENLGLIGESGCGKTTLARIIMKLVEADAGQIIFDGQDISRYSTGTMRPLRRQMQMVFQDPFNSLDPRFTIKSVLEEAMLFTPDMKPGQKLEKFKEILASVNLPEEVLGRYPHEFSGGERQRLAIARTLIMGPKLLVLDEAVSSLDVLVQEQIIQLLLDLKTKFPITYFFISHNMRVVKKLCPRLAVMYQGKIVEMGLTAEILSDPIHPYSRELLSAAVHYKSTGIRPVVDPQSRLVDRGNQHWVRE